MRVNSSRTSMWIKRRGVHEIVALNFPFRRHDFGCGGTGGNHIRLLSRDREGRSLLRRLFPFPLPLVGRGWGGGRAVMGLWQRAQVLSFSRRDFCSHPSYEQATPKNLAASQPSSDQPGSGVPNSSRSGTAHERTNGRRKKEAERRKARSHRRTCKVRRAPCGARSPSGVPLRLSPGRQLVPKAQRQATLLGRSGAFGPVRPPQPGGGDLAPCHGRYPRRKTKQPVPVPVSTSHAGHCAGRLMPDAARVQRGRTLCPRAPQPAPPAGVTGRRPFKQAGCTLLVRRGADFNKFRLRALSV